ncbi:MAG TPA: adenylate/guanylate cyclase domain-containing protein, partial [Gillisia sp.]|nr:adenylate/guanylate cyclase domain-containing protein [Gillisia sp.]
ALEAYFESLKLAYIENFTSGIGPIYISIANTYSLIGNPITSSEYYAKGIAMLRENNDSLKRASALLNAGDDAFNNKELDKALEYFEESGEIFNKINSPIGKAYNLGNVGMVYAEQGRDELAQHNINEAIILLEEIQEYYPIAVYLTYMADIYAKKVRMEEALAFANRSLSIATQYGLKEQISDANLKLSELYEKTEDFEKAYSYYQDHITYRDSITNIGKVQQMAELRTDYEISKKQTELDLLAQKQRTQKIIAIATAIALFLIILLAIGLYRRNRFIKRVSDIIDHEKQRSDQLLLNILPEETAQELKNYGKVKTNRFDSVTVMFTDFKDFTRCSENISPEILVESVDYYFSKFDEIIEKYNLEKIKTIGDAYMCAGGLPFPNKDHAILTVLAGIEIAEFVENEKNNPAKDIIPFEIRIGINTGTVVAGVVGKKKFAYDIWGDTVNIASRMESSSESGCINISENTYELIKDHFNCRYRGEINVKNKGMMKMFYVHCAHDNNSLSTFLKREININRTSTSISSN